MLKIKKITIENFRGIKLPLTINFEKGNTITSALIYGRNGTGKSSITEAWEWMHTFKIDRLEGREGVSALDHPHKSSNGVNAYINAEFQHSSINSAQVTFNPKKITQPNISGEYLDFKTKSKYPNYLRYSDLQDFVYKTKTEKYLYIAKYFGLEKFTKNQSDLQTAINKITALLKTNQSKLDSDINSINAITGLTNVDELIIINFINSLAKRHKLPEISSFNDYEAIKSALEKIIQANPITKELTEWRAFQTKQIKFYPIATVASDCEILEKLFYELKKNVESIKQIILSGLYEQSLAVIPQLHDKSKCPVCDNNFEGDLIQHIKEKHTALSVLNKKRKEFEEKKIQLEKQFDTLSKKISVIQSESSVTVLKELKEFFDDLVFINAELPGIISVLKKDIKDIDVINISEKPALKKIENLIKSESSLRKIVSDRIKTLEADETSKTLAKDYADLIVVTPAFKNYSINRSKVDYLSEIHYNLNSLSTHLTTFIQTQIQTTFDTIAADVIECFNTLESSNTFLKNPKINLITGKDKAVELDIEFVSERVSPAFKYLSESQVNSFGLSIFLGAVKHFNGEFKFFILDDIINSFDSFKRPKVSQLIAKKFSDFQVLMLTHDQIFFDTMQKNFPSWQRYKFTSWDYATGPRFILSKNYAEEIQGYLDEDNPIIAGQTLGRYLEWTLGVINENMQTPMRYKIENTYTLAEFYDPFIKRFKDKLKIADKKHKLVKLFDEFEQSTIFRNYCSHWKNEANGFTSSEIGDIFKKWLQIENLLHCSTCKSFVNFDSSTGVEYIKCNCGAIDLKSSVHYS